MRIAARSSSASATVEGRMSTPGSLTDASSVARSSRAARCARAKNARHGESTSSYWPPLPRKNASVVSLRRRTIGLAAHVAAAHRASATVAMRRVRLFMVFSGVAVKQRHLVARHGARLGRWAAPPQHERPVRAHGEYERGEREEEHEVRKKDEVRFHVQLGAVFSFPRRASLSQLMPMAANSSAAARSRAASSTTIYTARKSGLNARSQ